MWRGLRLGVFSLMGEIREYVLPPRRRPMRLRMFSIPVLRRKRAPPPGRHRVGRSPISINTARRSSRLSLMSDTAPNVSHISDFSAPWRRAMGGTSWNPDFPLVAEINSAWVLFAASPAPGANVTLIRQKLPSCADEFDSRALDTSTVSPMANFEDASFPFLRIESVCPANEIVFGARKS